MMGVKTLLPIWKGLSYENPSPYLADTEGWKYLSRFVRGRMYENISSDLTWVYRMKYITLFSMDKWDDEGFLVMPPHDSTKDNTEDFRINYHRQP